MVLFVLLSYLQYYVYFYIAKDKASEYLINKIDALGASGAGMGAKRRKTATPAQLAALAKGRAIRDANRYGGALLPA